MKQTTSSGCPIDFHVTKTAGHPGPVVLEDVHLLDKIGHFDRERIPERVVHAKGAGAHGYFEVTDDWSAFTKAKFLNRVGKRTPIFVRFSNMIGEKGSADTVRDIKGFAIKFYTEEGNWDLCGSNSPVFFIRDPIQYPDLIHSQKKHPQTHVKDDNAYWEFLSQVPEALHQIALLYSDRGLPDGYCHMNGYSGHTFKFVNAKGEFKFVKFHLISEQKIQNMSDEDAAALAGSDPDYATRDLFDRIESAKYPAWSVYIQMMDPEVAPTYRWNVFDITKVWPRRDFPLQKVGRIVLNRNPENYFSEVEQAAFSPSSLVPGIDPSYDKLLQGRLFACADAARYRLGANYMQLPVNCPFTTRVYNDYRDGKMNHGQRGPKPATPNSESQKPTAIVVKGEKQTVGYYSIDASNDDFVQPGEFWRNVLKEDEKKRIVQRMASTLSKAKTDTKEKILSLCSKADSEWASLLTEALATSRL